MLKESITEMLTLLTGYFGDDFSKQPVDAKY